LRKLRKILKICLVSGLLLWTLGFLLGTGMSLTWTLAKLAALLAPISGVVLAVMMITNIGAAPQDLRRKAGETLKCIECGRPSISGSRYCRYHHDLINEGQGQGTR